MANLIQHYGSKGFYKTPASKCILGGVFLSSCALNVPVFSYLKHYTICPTYNVINKHEIWRLLTRNFAFLDVKDLLCCCLLMYYLRIFERRHGSRKFLSHMLGKILLATILEIIAVLFCEKFLNIEINFLASGPYGMVFPLFIDFYYDIPRVTYSHLFGIPITGKSFVYLVGLQVLSDSKSSLLAGICCLISGYLHRLNFLKIQRIRIPRFISNLTEKSLGWLLFSTAPQTSNVMMGATLELQRQEILDAMEQATRSQQMRQFENHRHLRGQGYSETLVHPSANRNGNSQGFGLSWLRNRSNRTPAAAATAASDEMVNMLMEMGFERQNVLAALQSSNNDLTAATSILLNES